jgi:UDP-2,3-diacylglucosamine pyrophosphatase LpxH
MKANKRKIDILVLSDVHLGTYGCHAKELLYYLKSIKPKTVVLNGDIIDIWQFSKSYWPKSHMKVVKHLMNWIGKGVKTYYITGNHDEMLRKFEGMKIGSLSIVNKAVLELPDGKKAWFFHGDIFDITMQHSKWLARLGAIGYDTLIIINRIFNFFSERVLHRGKISLSKKIKQSVKSAISFIDSFEKTTADIGIYNKYDYVVCGHIHHPEIRLMKNAEGEITYLNSGDWVENLSALEYSNGEWKIYRYKDSEMDKTISDEDEDEEYCIDDKKLFNIMLNDFNLMKQ